MPPPPPRRLSRMKPRGVLPLLLLLVVLSVAAAATAAGAEDEAPPACAAEADEDLFYAWRTPLRTRSYVRALFPDVDRLQDAWEVRPLLSRVGFGSEERADEDDVAAAEARGEAAAEAADGGSHPMPSFVHDRSLATFPPSTAAEGEGSVAGGDDLSSDDRVLSMFQVNDALSILSSPDMIQGSDYNIIKKIMLPANSPHNPQPDDDPDAPDVELNGRLPKERYELEEILHHFHYGAFSVVINRIHRRWKSVGKAARTIEEELALQRVGGNLYLTPEVPARDEREGGEDELGDERQGFEAHWDWMDGEKRERERAFWFFVSFGYGPASAREKGRGARAVVCAAARVCRGVRDIVVVAALDVGSRANVRVRGWADGAFGTSDGTLGFIRFGVRGIRDRTPPRARRWDRAAPPRAVRTSVRSSRF
ncbi:hypothetical protein ACHAWF_016181 [Thalassiosira exigua]